MKIPTTLIILDGYGLAAPSGFNAASLAKTPVLDGLFAACPNTTLVASGVDVGLPEGQIGNSEVGHTNIGSGRVVYQELTRISHEIDTGRFYENHALGAAMDAAHARDSALHLLGLCSPGGVHSHTDHLRALLILAKRKGLKKVFLHCFTDGRDVAPKSAARTLSDCVQMCAEIGVGKIATVIGRFYAMDRDGRWERVERAYSAMVYGEGAFEPDPVKAAEDSYAADITDEFIEPVICDREGMIRPGDSVIFYNFRPDRAREITRAFVDVDFSEFKRKNGFFHVDYVCMTQYDEKMPNVTVAYPPEMPDQTLGETISRYGLTQLRIAETEKYAHVTFFFNGGVEDIFSGEDRVLIPSPKEFPTYDLVPEMSAYKVAAEASARIRSGKYDVVIINFANCDMVGHTGVLSAAVRAVETVDACVGLVLDAASEMGGVTLLSADHGNAEQMLAPDGITPHTAHTTNLVPLIIAGADVRLRPGRLSDIAPTMIDLMGLEKPPKMTGESLIVRR